ncbi:hypothetical protein BDD12DRAFT_808462 [Trichophaea hybrida]|nr:hypothetical protein BDD12DRAFT_808462 [Trichophaea hybrida]
MAMFSQTEKAVTQIPLGSAHVILLHSSFHTNNLSSLYFSHAFLSFSSYYLNMNRRYDREVCIHLGVAICKKNNVELPRDKHVRNAILHQAGKDEMKKQIRRDKKKRKIEQKVGNAVVPPSVVAPLSIVNPLGVVGSPSVVDPPAVISSSARIGSFVSPGVVVPLGVIGSPSVVDPPAVISSSARIGSFVSPGVVAPLGVIGSPSVVDPPAVFSSSAHVGNFAPPGFVDAPSAIDPPSFIDPDAAISAPVCPESDVASYDDYYKAIYTVSHVCIRTSSSIFIVLSLVSPYSGTEYPQFAEHEQAHKNRAAKRGIYQPTVSSLTQIQNAI